MEKYATYVYMKDQYGDVKKISLHEMQELSDGDTLKKEGSLSKWTLITDEKEIKSIEDKD